MQDVSKNLQSSLLSTFNDQSSSTEHTLSIIIMINEKFRLGIPIFDILCKENKDKFTNFFDKTVELSDNMNSLKSSVVYIQYLINAFRSLENPVLRSCALRYLSIPIWSSLSEGRRNNILAATPRLLPHWQNYLANKPDAAFNSGGRAKKPRREEQSPSNFRELDATWIPSLLRKLICSVEQLPKSGDDNINDTVLYISKFMEFFIDLLSQFHTRKFLNRLIEDSLIVVRCKRSRLYLNKIEAVDQSNLALFKDLVDMLDMYSNFQVDDQTGEAFTEQEVLATIYSRIKMLQQVAFSHPAGETLKDLIFASRRAIGKPESLKQLLEFLRAEDIVSLAKQMNLLSDHHLAEIAEVDPTADIVEFALDAIAAYVQIRPSQLEELNRLALYPDENILWGSSSSSSVGSIVGSLADKGQRTLALPKLNLQFLTLHDYLLRNFKLFCLESAYQIREDIVDAVQRVQPKEGFRKGSINSTVFGGWARMALPLNGAAISRVAKPLLGELAPARVSCTVEIDLSRCSFDKSGDAGRAEWEALKEHDVVFLVSIQSPSAAALEQMAVDGKDSFTDKFGTFHTLSLSIYILFVCCR